MLATVRPPGLSTHKEEGEECIHQLMSHWLKVSTMCINSLDFQAEYVGLPSRSLVFHFPAGNEKPQDGNREDIAEV